MGNIFDKHEQLVCDYLDRHPQALDILVFYWLRGGDDGAFVNGAGYANADGSDHLPRRSDVFPEFDFYNPDAPPPFQFTGASGGFNSTYCDDFVRPILEFAWAHGYLEQVSRCQTGLRAAGLGRYCLGDP